MKQKNDGVFGDESRFDGLLTGAFIPEVQDAHMCKYSHPVVNVVVPEGMLKIWDKSIKLIHMFIAEVTFEHFAFGQTCSYYTNGRIELTARGGNGDYAFYVSKAVTINNIFTTNRSKNWIMFQFAGEWTPEDNYTDLAPGTYETRARDSSGPCYSAIKTVTVAYVEGTWEELYFRCVVNNCARINHWGFGCCST